MKRREGKRRERGREEKIMIIDFGNKGRKEGRKKERKLSMKEWNITIYR